MKWNMDICLNNNYLPGFSFISLTSESETNVDLHQKLKLTDINLSRYFKISFTTMLLHIPVCILVQKIAC